jgi:hypothetical protein
MSVSCSVLRNLVSNLFMYLPAKGAIFRHGSRLPGAL